GTCSREDDREAWLPVNEGQEHPDARAAFLRERIRREPHVTSRLEQSQIAARNDQGSGAARLKKPVRLVVRRRRDDARSRLNRTEEERRMRQRLDPGARGHEELPLTLAVAHRTDGTATDLLDVIASSLYSLFRGQPVGATARGLPYVGG